MSKTLKALNDDNEYDEYDEIKSMNTFYCAKIGHLDINEYKFKISSTFFKNFKEKEINLIHGACFIEQKIFCADDLDKISYKETIDIIELYSLYSNLESSLVIIYNFFGINPYFLKDDLINFIILSTNILNNIEDGTVNFEQLFIILHCNKKFYKQRDWEIKRIITLIALAKINKKIKAIGENEDKKSILQEYIIELPDLFKYINDSFIPNNFEIIDHTGKYIGEGFDLPKLDTLFLALPISWKGSLAQYVGRIHRQFKNKERVIVYDYVDENLPMLQRMFQKRIKGYEAMGYILSFKGEDALMQTKLKLGNT